VRPSACLWGWGLLIEHGARYGGYACCSWAFVIGLDISLKRLYCNLINPPGSMCTPSSCILYALVTCHMRDLILRCGFFCQLTALLATYDPRCWLDHNIPHQRYVGLTFRPYRTTYTSSAECYMSLWYLTLRLLSYFE
jgi:hypothetical protein